MFYFICYIYDNILIGNRNVLGILKKIYYYKKYFLYDVYGGFKEEI